ncbi:MAG TPA: M4 family metallopeptidase [Saprospiraceae bacterium]|nr:M4 family metallopeptidase [Saprospiraceae bacterium]
MLAHFSSFFQNSRLNLTIAWGLLFFCQASILVAQQPDAALIRLLRETQGTYINYHRSTGAPAFVRWPDHAPLALPGNNLMEKAAAFFETYGRVFGIQEPARELAFVVENKDKTGYTHLKFKQLHLDTEVFGGEVLLHFDADGMLHTVNGVFIPGIRQQYAQPLQTSAQAEALALAHIEDLKLSDFPDRPLLAHTHGVFWYHAGLAQGIPGEPILAYEVEVANDADLRQLVYVDVVKGAVADRLPGTCELLFRRVYNVNTGTQVWQEGNAFPGSLSLMQQNMVEAAGHTYYLFKNLFGLDSYNGAGAEMRGIYNASISCPNANWNGTTTNFCTNVASDDVVAHEWGHAYTEFGPGLIYAWQAGALNESYSDIWGEVVDLLNAYEDSGEDLSLRTGCGTSLRWMMGEDASAFGGAIRDMWNPQCKSHPGKVSDSNYRCTSADNGGVHSNSGIPNHIFALLTDGGTYNSQTISGLGLTKTMHLFGLARQYLTRTGDFGNMADALETACAALVGINLEGISLTATPAGPSGQMFSAADCTEVTEAIAAVELRAAPPCSFTPLLDAASPALCPMGTTQSNIYTMDFEAGATGWTISEHPTNPATWTARTWQLNSSLPRSRPGTGISAANAYVGNCSSDLENGIQRLQSPVISIPPTAATTLRLSFEHYVSLESTWDGGNLKYSKNGGAWTLLPASAFVFNAYNSSLQTVGAGNDNPLAGQTAFTAANEGSVAGSWGQSQINLAAIGIAPGDNVQLRWELGEDGCNGWDGWYLDDVVLCQCQSALPVSLLSFSAEAEKSSVQLRWATAQERNNAGFEVQRRDGWEMEFKTIAWAPGKLDADLRSDYAHEDADVRPGLSYYYRLRQVDADGTGTFSQVVAARIKPEETVDLHLFPNPTHDLLFLQPEGSWGAQLNVSLTDLLGRVVHDARLEHQTADAMSLSLAHLPPGMYLLRAGDGLRSLVRKVWVR